MDSIIPQNDPNRAVKIGGAVAIGCVVLCGCLGTVLLVFTWVAPLLGSQ